jgi:antitoxin YefM
MRMITDVENGIKQLGNFESETVFLKSYKILYQIVYNLYMPTLNLEQDIVPLSDFRANASPLLKRLREGGAPVVVTHNGRAAAVMLGVSEYQRLQSELEELRAMVGGLLDARQGKTVPHEHVVEAIKQARDSG